MSLVFYESPHRLSKTLLDLAQYFPKNQISLQRELTKLHEEVVNDTVKNMQEKIGNESVKGEVTLVIY